MPDDTESDERLSQCEDEFPAYMDLVKDIPPTTPHTLDGDELYHMPEGNKNSGWQNCQKSTEKYDKELCQAYREQIDTLLVFAGLFSAVVTAFAVESYQWLQDDPTDTSVQLLRDVVGLLSQNLNLTSPPTATDAPRLPGPVVVRINSVWFLSLSLSLSAALVAILCKQWLREFERDVGQSPEMALSVRHIRFQGFEFWKVGPIITAVPIIMQLALALFIAGIVELLWRLHIVVACCVSVVAGLTLLFYVSTTFLPVIQYAYICVRCCGNPSWTGTYPSLKGFTAPQCAFKSAQAWFALRAIQPVLDLLLRVYGRPFIFHHPPHHFALELRPADSWVTFDINWVKRREHIHAGPRCAFESLTWIAANLGEINLSSWIWHCVWARWFGHQYSHSAITAAVREINSVARSYPRLVDLSETIPPIARSQALLFRCSLRTDIPVDTAAELFLRIAPVVGVNSLWTREAIHAILLVNRDTPIRLSDDVAIGLFRLAELMTHTLLYEPDGPNSRTQLNAALAFKEVLVLLHRGSRFRDIFMPAMSGLVLQWLRSRPPEHVARVGRVILDDMVRHLVLEGYYGERLHELRHCRGIMFISKLAGAVAEWWPEFVRDRFPDEPFKRNLLHELLAMFAEGFPDIPQGTPGAETLSEGGNVSVSDAGMDIPPSPAVGADGERSQAPAPDDLVNGHAGEETHVETPGGTSQAAVASVPLRQDHVRLDVHVTEEPDGNLETEVDDDSPASPMDNPVARASPPRVPVSPGLSVPPSTSEHEP